MDKLLIDYENLKISAFSKYSKLTGDINNVTIGPNSTIICDISHDHPKTPVTSTPKKSSSKKENRPGTSSQKTQLPLPHILKELENQRREKVQEAIDDHYNRFESFTKTQKQEKESQWLLKQQAFIHNMYENEQRILQTVSQQDVNTAKQNEKLRKHYQDMAQRKLQYEQQLERNREKQRILNENMEKIKKLQLEFRSVYQEIIAIIKTCTSNEDLKKLLGDSFKLLKTLPEGLDDIIAKCRSYTVNDEHITKASNIVIQVKTLKIQIEEAVSSINNKKKEEEVKAAVQPLNVPKVSVITKPVEESGSTISSLNQCISAPNLKKYVEIKQFLVQHSELFRELLNNEQLKQFRSDCKKAVNIPVSAISDVNAEHLKDKYVRLSSLLSGKTVIVADKQINASKHPQGIPFCMDLLARKFVLQGDLMISSKLEAAFCYATVIVSLWNDFPDFGRLLLGYFYSQYPYIVPFYMPKMEDQTIQDYYTSLGYCYVDGQIEKQSQFLKRMTGIFRLYFAIMIAKPKRGQAKNPYDITNAWNFLVSILKLEPVSDITATALHVFLETVGFEMEMVYGLAFKKLVRIIMEKFVPLLKSIDTGGPVSRLETLLQDYKKTGHFEQPSGILSTNFW